jgi:hypothetical protein
MKPIALFCRKVSIQGKGEDILFLPSECPNYLKEALAEIDM